MHCFYHNDMDGRCAAAIVARYTNNFDLNDYSEVDYMTPLPLDNIADGEEVFLVDYSFKKDTVWQLQKLIDKGCFVVWIDHHTSSLNLENEMPELKKIEGLRVDKISGTALTYMYLYDLEFDDLPNYVKFVSDYDCWIYKYDPDTTYFKIGIETYKFNALDDIWVRLFEESEDNGYYNQRTPALDSIIRVGEIIKSYIDKDNKMYCDQWSYETLLEEHKCLVINRKSNSWIFGDKYNEYPVVMVWAFNGTKYSYSIYSSNPEVDCSKIAEKYGGGGHRGAAGFTSDELLFKKI